MQFLFSSCHLAPSAFKFPHLLFIRLSLSQESKAPSNLACQSKHSNCFCSSLGLPHHRLSSKTSAKTTTVKKKKKEHRLLPVQQHSWDIKCTQGFSASFRGADDCMVKSPINFTVFWGKSTEKLSCGPKLQSETGCEWQTGEEDPVCVASERDCVLSKKVEVRHPEYIPTGMRLRDNAVRFTTKSGCGDGGGAFKGRRANFQFLPRPHCLVTNRCWFVNRSRHPKKFSLAT